MPRGRGRDCQGCFQFDPFWAKVLEEANAMTKEDRDQMNLHLVQQARLEILLNDLRAPPDPDILAAGDGRGLREASPDPIGDERIRRTALPRERWPRPMTDHEHRQPVERRRVAPRL